MDIFSCISRVLALFMLDLLGNIFHKEDTEDIVIIVILGSSIVASILVYGFRL